MLISVEGTSKNQLAPGKESMGGDPDLSHCFLLRNPLTKPTVALELCREGVIKSCFSIFRDVSFWLHPLGDEECQYTFIYSQVFWYSSSCKLCLRVPVTFWSYYFTWTPASSHYFELLMWKPGHGSGGYSLICDRVLAQLDSRPVHFGITVNKLAVGESLPSASVSPRYFYWLLLHTHLFIFHPH